MISLFDDDGSWEEMEAQDRWEAYCEWAREKRDDIDDLIREARRADKAQDPPQPDQQEA